jgi:hypothetical protein
MSFILVIYTVVAVANYRIEQDWRPLGEFASAKACNDARETLGAASKERTRCLAKGTP